MATFPQNEMWLVALHVSQMASWCMQICRALAIQSGQSSQTFSHQSISDFSNCRAFYWNESCLEHPSCNAYSLKCIPHTLISRSRHVEIENETPVVRNPEVTVKHQPGSTATAITSLDVGRECMSAASSYILLRLASEEACWNSSAVFLKV